MELFQHEDRTSSPPPDMNTSSNVHQPLDNRFLCCSILRCMEVPLRQDVSESVQLLCQLSYPQLQLLVFLLELLGPLLGQHDPPPSLVPALSHGDVVPLSPQSILCAVLVDVPLVRRRLQGWKKEHREVLEAENTNMLTEKISIWVISQQGDGGFWESHQRKAVGGFLPVVRCCDSAAGWSSHRSGSWDRRRGKAGTTDPSSAQPPCHRRPPSPVPATDCTESCRFDAADWTIRHGWTEQAGESGGGPDLGMPTPGWQTTPAIQTSEGSNNRRIRFSCPRTAEVMEAATAFTTTQTVCEKLCTQQQHPVRSQWKRSKDRINFPKDSLIKSAREEWLMRRFMFHQDNDQK